MRASSVSDFALHFSCSKVLLIIMYIIPITLRCVLLYPCLKLRKLKHRWYVICPRSEILFTVDWVPIHSMGSRSHTWTLLSSVQSFSPVWLFATPWTAAFQASLFITNFQSLLKLMSIEWVMPSSHLILRHPCLLLPSVFPSIRVFSNESVLCIRWSKC